MALWQLIFFLVPVVVTFTQSVLPGQDVYRFPNAQVLATHPEIPSHSHPMRVVMDDGEQRAIKYVYIDSKKPANYPTGSSQIPVNLPHLPDGDWNQAHISFDDSTGKYIISNTSLIVPQKTMSHWHHRKIEYVDFATIKILQHDRLQIVSHPHFTAPFLLKIASFPWEMPSITQEVDIYRRLYGSGATPEFLGHVTEDGRTIGFITEYIEEVPGIKGMGMGGCLDALRIMHGKGIAHGDAHDGNCLVRGNGTAVIIDFELSLEDAGEEELERDLDVMGRCIEEVSLGDGIGGDHVIGGGII